MEYRIEINIARKGAECWNYLMEDEYTACSFSDKNEALGVVAQENRDATGIRLVEFNALGIGSVVSV